MGNERQHITNQRTAYESTLGVRSEDMVCQVGCPSTLPHGLAGCVGSSHMIFQEKLSPFQITGKLKITMTANMRTHWVWCASMLSYGVFGGVEMAPLILSKMFDKVVLSFSDFGKNVRQHITNQTI